MVHVKTLDVSEVVVLFVGSLSAGRIDAELPVQQHS